MRADASCVSVDLSEILLKTARGDTSLGFGAGSTCAPLLLPKPAVLLDHRGPRAVSSAGSWGFTGGHSLVSAHSRCGRVNLVSHTRLFPVHVHTPLLPVSPRNKRTIRTFRILIFLFIQITPFSFFIPFFSSFLHALLDCFFFLSFSIPSPLLPPSFPPSLPPFLSSLQTRFDSLRLPDMEAG